MKKHFAVVLLLVFLAACGGGSSSPSSPTPPAPVTPVNATGQWEIIGLSSSGSGKAVVIETNLAKNSTETIFANSSNTVVIDGTATGQSVTLASVFGLDCDQGQIGFDSLDATFTTGSATQASFTASDAGPSGSTQATGTVNFNSQGTSIASGSYSAPAACGAPADSGTVTGIKISPFSGSYAGMFNSGANAVIVTVTETASTFSFTVSGTDNGAPLSLTGSAVGGAFVAAGTDNGVATSVVGVYDPVGNDFLVYTNASPPSFMGQLHAGTNPASVAKPGMFTAKKR